jgi:hypothetical protein
MRRMTRQDIASNGRADDPAGRRDALTKVLMGDLTELSASAGRRTLDFSVMELVL